MSDEARGRQAHRDSQGNITYLLMAELVHGQPALFGVKVRATDYDTGLKQLFRLMNQDGGKQFLEVENLQALVQVRLIQCPSCGNITPVGQKACSHCKMNLQTPEVVAAIQQGKARVIQHVEYQLKALHEGTENMYRLRPEHIVLYDIVPPDSPAYKKWVETAEIAKNQMREIRTGITMPSAGDVAALKMDQVRRKMKDQ